MYVQLVFLHLKTQTTNCSDVIFFFTQTSSFFDINSCVLLSLVNILKKRSFWKSLKVRRIYLLCAYVVTGERPTICGLCLYHLKWNSRRKCQWRQTVLNCVCMVHIFICSSLVSLPFLILYCSAEIQSYLNRETTKALSPYTEIQVQGRGNRAHFGQSSGRALAAEGTFLSSTAWVRQALVREALGHETFQSLKGLFKIQILLKEGQNYCGKALKVTLAKVTFSLRIKEI